MDVYVHVVPARAQLLRVSSQLSVDFPALLLDLTKGQSSAFPKNFRITKIEMAFLAEEGPDMSLTNNPASPGSLTEGSDRLTGSSNSFSRAVS